MQTRRGCSRRITGLSSFLSVGRLAVFAGAWALALAGCGDSGNSGGDGGTDGGTLTPDASTQREGGARDASIDSGGIDAVVVDSPPLCTGDAAMPVDCAHNLCVSDPVKTQAGLCGCGVSEMDSDGDGTPDCLDGCPKDPTRTAPGPCGCGTPNTRALCLAHRYTFDVASPDGGAPTDAGGTPSDGAAPDAGTPDAGTPDAGALEAGSSDAAAASDAAPTSDAGATSDAAGGGSTAVIDSVGGANGTAVNVTLSGNGTIVLSGTNQYVRLPAGIASSLGNSVTFEAWVSWAGTRNWQRIFDFGTAMGGVGQDYIFLTPFSGPGALRAAFTVANGAAGEQIADALMPLPLTTMVDVALVVDGATDVMTLYQDGMQVGTTPLAATALNNLIDQSDWLGRSLYTVDPYFAGTIYEFRIYSAARTAAQVLASSTAGPDVLPAQ